MKNRVAILVSAGVLWTVILIVGLSALMPNQRNKITSTLLHNIISSDSPKVPKIVEVPKLYTVYSYNKLLQSFEFLDDAIEYAKTIDHGASVRSEQNQSLLWNNYTSFRVYQNGKIISDAGDYTKAVTFAKKYTNTKVYFEGTTAPVWTSNGLTSRQIRVSTPLISQMPELPRGCEVTSLAMLLQSAGVAADKMRLAKEIKKDSTPYQRKNGVTYYGNPYDGFVGDMYTFSKPGYGVYHGPIRELAEQYLPKRIIDMTGSTFQDILQSLNRGAPVWVIANTNFSRLPESSFLTWQTPAGPLKITYKSHSVLITGYDNQFIYFNDPLTNIKDRQVPLRAFQEAWEQMGSQAITYVK